MKFMPIYDFSPEKNQQLLKERGISFEMIIAAIYEGKLLETVKHPSETQYPNQHVYLVDIDHYVYVVPFVKKSEAEVFLKTIFPSRKLTKKYFP